MDHHRLPPSTWIARHRTALTGWGLACLMTTAWPLWAAEPEAPPKAAEAIGKSLTEQLREATKGNLTKKQLTVTVNGQEVSGVTTVSKPSKPTAPNRPAGSLPVADTQVSEAPAPAVQGSKPAPAVSYQRARTAATTGHAAPTAHAKEEHAHEVHWAYEGEGGPEAWGQLRPDFKTCGLGKRQSPIHIQDGNALQGPAEAIQFSYQPSQGTVVNNGHTIQVDVQGDNSISVRGSNYKLLQFHFHHPSEERINHKVYAMVAHLVHRNAQGQLAVVAVLLDPGAANPLINKVWTYMPLDKGDHVSMPAGLLDLNELLPKDQRYYQFLGSLTTPPCTEGVLWLVLKQASPISPEQIKLFSQLYPHNARPVQPLHGRPIRDAQ